MRVTEELAHFVATCADIPAEARVQAQRAVLDTTGVMLAGSLEECARIAAAVVHARGSRPVATVVGQGFRTSPDAAALANGVAAHALDYDDVNDAMTGHPSAPLVPALLAVAEEMHASGRALLDALVLGFEVEARLGRGMGPSHYSRGWHATATLGVLAAAAAAARLYGLGATQTGMALGIAVSLAGGSRQNFGTMTKPLHPGHAAQDGIVAAQLAGRGFTADATAIEAPLGYLSLFSPDGDADPQAVLAGLGQPFEILDSGLSVKLYPCCFATHRAIEAALGLLEAMPFDPGTVERIVVRQPRGSGVPLIHSRPSTGLEGKFSMEYCVAAAILDGRVDLASFEDTAVQRATAQRLLRSVKVETTADESKPAEGYADLEIDLAGGKRLYRRVDEPRGVPDLPLTLDQLVAKFRNCAQRVLSLDATERTLALLLELDRLDSIAPLTDLLSAPVATPSI